MTYNNHYKNITYTYLIDSHTKMIFTPEHPMGVLEKRQQERLGENVIVGPWKPKRVK